jgi:integrase
MTKEKFAGAENEDEKLYEDRVSRKYALDAEHEEKLRVACYSNKNKASRWVFIYCCMGVFGMRVSEMCHIHSSWLEFDKPGEECIRIPSKMKCDCHDCMRPLSDDPKAARGVWRPKMKSTARVIPGRLNVEAYWFIKKYLEDAELALESGKVKRDPVPRDRKKAWTTVKLLSARAGTKNVFPQALRATAATHMARHPKMTPLMLMHIMGLSSLDTANEYFEMVGTGVLKDFNPSEYQSKAEDKERKAEEKKMAEARKALEKNDEIVVKLAMLRKPAPAMKSMRTCPVCQALNGAAARECKSCGAEL